MCLDKGGRRGVVGELPMQADIEADFLLILGHPQRDEPAHDFEQNERADGRQADRYQHVDQLNQHLIRIAVDQSVIAGLIDFFAGKDACSESAPNAAKPVNAEHVKRIVVLKPRFEVIDAEIADEAGCKADHKGGGDGYEAGSRSDGR